MSFYVSLLLATISFPVCIAVWKGVRVEACLPYGIILTTILAFCFGLLNALPIGAIAVGVLCVMALLASVLRVARAKARRAVLAKVCTPAMLLYLVASVCIVWALKNRAIWVQDDYNYWFRAWRAMWVDQKLPLYPHADFMLHQSYPPGLPTLEYLVSKLHGSFVQGDAFCMYAMYCVALLMPLFERLTWRRAWLFPVAAFAALVMPMAFNTFLDADYVTYEALVADNALGLTFGLALYTALVESPTKGRLIRLSLLCAMLVLIKTSGLSLAMIAWTAALTMDLIRAAQAKPEGGRGKLRWIQVRRILPPFVACACLPMLLYALWHWKLASLSIDTLYAVHPDGKVLIDLLLKRDTSYRAKAVSAFLRFPWQQLAVNNPQGIVHALNHWKLAALLALPAAALLVCARDRAARVRHAVGMVSVGIGYIVYAVGLLMVYLFAVPKLEGWAVLPSFNRYMSTYYQAAFVCLFGWAMRDAFAAHPGKESRTRIAARVALAYLLALLVATLPLPQIYGRVVERRNFAADALDPYARIANRLSAQVPSEARIGVYYLQYVYFGKNLQAAAYPLHIEVRDAFPPVCSPEQRLSDEGWKQVRAYDYVYLAEVDQAFAETYGFLFAGGLTAMEEGRLYQVKPTGDADLSFVPIAEER